MFFVDAHCDTLSKALDEQKDIFNNDLQFSITNANNLGGGIQVMACFVDTEYLDNKNGGFNRCDKILNKFKEYEKNNNVNILIKNKNDLLESINGNQTRVILSIENGSAICGDLKNIDYFYNQGVRIMSVTWNDDNELGCGAKTNNDTGLTKLGYEYIKKLNEYGIIVDVSHLSKKSFWDVINYSTKPVIATHSNVYEICKNPRNLKDEQIKAIAEKGGVIGICYYSDFLNSKETADVRDIVKHIKYIRDLVGINHIGLGSDFDGMDYKKVADGVKNVSEINNITIELKKQGFLQNEIKKIFRENWINFLKNIL